WARAPAHVLLHEIGHAWIIRSRRADKRRRVAQHGIGGGEGAPQPLQRNQLGRAEYGLERTGLRACRIAEDRDLVLFARITDSNVEKKASELSFGERGRAPLLDLF